MLPCSYGDCEMTYLPRQIAVTHPLFLKLPSNCLHLYSLTLLFSTPLTPPNTHTLHRLLGHPCCPYSIGQRSLCHGQAEETCAGVPGCQAAEDFTEGSLLQITQEKNLLCIRHQSSI